jgi:hypothetical protein
MNFEIGDLMVIQIALTFYFKDMDLSLSCAQQIQQTVAKTELAIQQLNTAVKIQGTNRPGLQPPLKPTN